MSTNIVGSLQKGSAVAALSLQSSSSRKLKQPPKFVSVESEFSSDVQKALEGVRKACIVTKKLQRSMSIGTITKSDASPVTVADFCSQAIVLKHLKANFPNDIFLAEESSDSLTLDVTNQIIESLRDDKDLQKEYFLKECIDLGQTFFDTPKEERSRVWCLDPIDGTKGFLRNEQYCVALALLEEGVPTIGILACPNLPFDYSSKMTSGGCIFVACKGEGSYQLSMEKGKMIQKLEHSTSSSSYDLSLARFCVNVEQSFADPEGKCKEMAKILHGSLDNETGDILYVTRMDSQAKYGVVARGDAEFYVRLPKPDYKDWIWDVAPGVLLLEEIGGVVTDTEGNALDFSVGAKLESTGILGARTLELHDALLDAYRRNN